jgi:hypothetical protein
VYLITYDLNRFFLLFSDQPMIMSWYNDSDSDTDDFNSENEMWYTPPVGPAAERPAPLTAATDEVSLEASDPEDTPAPVAAKPPGKPKVEKPRPGEKLRLMIAQRRAAAAEKPKVEKPRPGEKLRLVIAQRRAAAEDAPAHYVGLLMIAPVSARKVSMINMVRRKIMCSYCVLFEFSVPRMWRPERQCGRELRSRRTSSSTCRGTYEFIVYYYITYMFFFTDNP